MLLLCGQGMLVMHKPGKQWCKYQLYLRSVSVYSAPVSQPHTPREKFGKSRETSERIGKKRIISEKNGKKGTKSDAAIAQAVFITKG